MTILFIAAGVAVGGVCYWLYRLLRRFWCWAKRRELIEERVVVFAPLSMLLGGFMGWLMAEPVMTALACAEAGKSWLSCGLNLG